MSQTKRQNRNNGKETLTQNEKPAEETLTLPEVYERALRGGRYRRRAWKNSVGDVFVKRGETKLSIGNKKYAAPYLPSQEDAIAKDWIEIR